MGQCSVYICIFAIHVAPDSLPGAMFCPLVKMLTLSILCAGHLQYFSVENFQVIFLAYGMWINCICFTKLICQIYEDIFYETIITSHKG